jgi:hypothetical protein
MEEDRRRKEKEDLWKEISEGVDPLEIADALEDTPSCSQVTKFEAYSIEPPKPAWKWSMDAYRRLEDDLQLTRDPASALRWGRNGAWEVLDAIAKPWRDAGLEPRWDRLYDWIVESADRCAGAGLDAAGTVEVFRLALEEFNAPASVLQDRRKAPVGGTMDPEVEGSTIEEIAEGRGQEARPEEVRPVRGTPGRGEAPPEPDGLRSGPGTPTGGPRGPGGAPGGGAEGDLTGARAARREDPVGDLEAEDLR